MVPGRASPGGGLDLACRDLRRRCPTARHEAQAQARRAARLRLPLHRPAQLHAQRPGVPVRPDPPPVAGRCGHRRGRPPDRRAGVGHRASVVAGRHPHRVRVRAPSRSRPRVPASDPRRRRHEPARPRRDRRSTLGLRQPDVAARRQDDRGTRVEARGTRREPQRHLAVPGRRIRGAGDGRHEPVRPTRPDAGLGHGERSHTGRGGSAVARPGRRQHPLHGTDRRQLRAVAHRDRRRGRPADRPRAGTTSRRSTPSPGGVRRVTSTCVRARPSCPMCGSRTATARRDG